ncbi:dihydrolipoyllysine-residue acetyltransferase component of pyruvatedehydrogenase complex [Candidatus Photodesmus katoptron Akat1]|uniref:Dihydrolipoamide acetyltransferase component of pyruvate dehydrogenase complex n=1 Tax=Candidatus Photodesmus katoptron Akat1 TaxID=1236703 RepID=S3DJI8_9GAMM|nr:dihydrolipoyllysine-residue acetyltransferase component of pyruvatedehydrogenase complex [Candidatus Photodesmus katoptron Akat1]
MIIEINVPDIGSDEVEITEILVNIGDTVSKDQSLITVEGDKASMEIPSPCSGVIKEIQVLVGDKVSSGSPFMSFSIEKSENFISDDVHKEISSKDNSDHYVYASPIVRRLARELDIDLSRIFGTGRKGRILKEDIQAYIEGVKSDKGKLIKREEDGREEDGKNLLNLLPWPEVDFSKFGEIETSPIPRVKKKSGANLHRNWVMIPHVTQWDSVNVTKLEEFRKEQNINNSMENGARKITLLSFIMKAVAKALEKFPTFNSSLSNDGESLIIKKYINIGIAVDTPNGLVVPVFQNVNKRGIYKLSEDLISISRKARAGTLKISDMQGGGFTISSLGSIGGTSFTPIINAPEVAILGISKSEIKPVWNGNEFQPQLQLPLSLSYDHRVIDGAEGARFITFLNSILSDVRRLIL